MNFPKTHPNGMQIGAVLTKLGMKAFGLENKVSIKVAFMGYVSCITHYPTHFNKFLSRLIVFFVLDANNRDRDRDRDRGRGRGRGRLVIGTEKSRIYKIIFDNIQTIRYINSLPFCQDVSSSIPIIFAPSKIAPHSLLDPLAIL